MQDNLSQIITDNINNLLERINKACIQANRDPSTVKLLMATKTQDVETIKLALAIGQTLIGENKVQEVKEKYPVLSEQVTYVGHFIGHLQTNKINELLKHQVSCIQSLDRLDLAQKLNKRLELLNKKIQVMIQVNTSGEESKFGCNPKNALELVEQVLKLEHLELVGFMTIGANTDNQQDIVRCFEMLRYIQQQAQQQTGREFPELSMGMSGDLELAIAHGATIIRVGTAIFGQRDYSKK